MSEIIKSFTNSAGNVYPVHGISPLLPDLIRTAVTSEWNRAGRALPEVPAYEVELADGHKQKFPHNETTLETDEDRAAWAAYQAADNEFEQEINLRVLKAVCLAVDVDPMQDKAWREEQAVIGVDLPENPAELRLQYVQTQVIKSADDTARLMTAVMVISGLMDEDQAAAAEAAFRGEMEKVRPETNPS